MKKCLFRFVLAGAALLLLGAYVFIPPAGEPVSGDVKEILKSACFDCHSDQGSSKKAKLALNFDSWDDYKVSKRISKLEEICELVEEGKMPPEKYLKSKPDRALSEQQKVQICKWTAKETEKLLGSGE